MKKSAMIVDDSRVARMLLKKLLQAADFDIIEFDSGETALSYLDGARSYPNIIFMDVMMDGIDGLAATKIIKEDSKLKAIPVVMCTGNDTEEDYQRAKEVGAVTALTKPPEAKALTAILASISAQRSIKDPSSAIDEAAIIATVSAKIEQEIIPKLEQQSQEIVLRISQQIIAEQVGPAAQQACNVVAEESVLALAVQAVQVVVDEADVPTQVKQLLEQQGEEWLTDQEEELGSQLSVQLEQHIPTMVAQRLDESLDVMVANAVIEFLAKQDAESNNVLDEQQVELMIHTAVNEVKAQSELAQKEQISQLNEQIGLNRKLIIGLGIAVFGLLVLSLL